MVLLPFLPDDVLEDAFAFADVPTLRALKGVSKAWRARARRVLCARLCARFGLSLTSILVEVTTLDLSGSRDAGRLFADAADAACGLPNLARVTGLGGFEVDVAKLNDVMPSFMYPIGHPPKWPMTEVRACIEGEGVAPAPMEVLFAAFALRTGEAVVPACAFRGDTSMTSIELPAGLTSIGEYAFKGCSSLTSIKLPAGITSLGRRAFEGCSSLTSIELPTALTSLERYAFFGCTSLTSIELPASLTSLGESAFAECSSLASIKVPASLTNLGTKTFGDCVSFMSIKVPVGFVSLGEHAFYGCSSLTSIQLFDVNSSLTWQGEAGEAVLRCTL